MRLIHVLLPLALTAITLVILTSIYPLSDDFRLENPYWNGMESLSNRSLPVSMSDVPALDPRNYTVLIIGPSTPFTSAEIDEVKMFLSKGGRVVLADEFGTGNQLLEAIGAPLRLNGSLLLDPLLNLGVPQLPLAYSEWGRIALNYATVLNATCPGCRVIANSSFFSYLDLNGNGRYDKDEPSGPFFVAISLRIHGGELIVLSDSSLFINSMLNRESNSELLRALIGQTRPAVVVDKWPFSPLSAAKSALSSAWRIVSSPEIKYSLALSILLAAVMILRSRKH
mgnify:FL=1